MFNDYFYNYPLLTISDHSEHFRPLPTTSDHDQKSPLGERVQMLFEFFLYLDPIMRYFISVCEEPAAEPAASEPEVVYEAASLR